MAPLTNRNHRVHLLLIRKHPNETEAEALVFRPTHGQRWTLPSVEPAMPTRNEAAAQLTSFLQLCTTNHAVYAQSLLNVAKTVHAVRNTATESTRVIAAPFHGKLIQSSHFEWGWVPVQDVSRCTDHISSRLALTDAVNLLGNETEPKIQSGSRQVNAPTRALCRRQPPVHLQDEPRIQVDRQLEAEDIRRSMIPQRCARLSAAACDEVQHLAVDQVAINVTQCGAVDPSYIRTLMETSKARAMSRGSTEVTARDVADAASTLVDARKPKTVSPADHVPFHYDALCERLSAVKDRVLRLRGKGIPAPRVLVIGETSGVIAGMFMKAGADVLTCDLQPTETPHIPHCLDSATGPTV